MNWFGCVLLWFRNSTSLGFACRNNLRRLCLGFTWYGTLNGLHRWSLICTRSWPIYSNGLPPFISSCMGRMLQKTRSCMVNRILSWIRIRRLRTSHESAIIHCNRWEHTKAWSLIILRNLFGRFISIKRILPWFAASISRSMNPGGQGPRALFSPSTLGLHMVQYWTSSHG
jgi:hypothetical protein